ncbi:unnamed protein product [Paramecium octaurelia]|uniref:Uncharacterized protein n=1 Tax=Paramecium octaurelia TaxID=43137 RepID=A0A8S1S4D0_PAROT|nr:unnamed protein product [Paramecium octaurelia]
MKNHILTQQISSQRTQSQNFLRLNTQIPQVSYPGTIEQESCNKDNEFVMQLRDSEPWFKLNWIDYKYNYKLKIPNLKFANIDTHNQNHKELQ